MKKRRVCVFTGTRADYGLLEPLMRKIQEARELDLLILASGSHLSQFYGDTIKKIEQDGFVVHEKIDIELISDTPQAICHSMGLGMIHYSEALSRMEPDMVVILGDRYEAFTMASASTVCRVPVAHIHGGETTEGVIDEAFRHSITKMSHLHFTSTEDYRRRVIQLGEHPDKVHNVGALGVENIRRIKLLTRKNLEKEINFSLGNSCILVTFHPVTLENKTAGDQFRNVLDAVKNFKKLRIIFTKTNADTDGRIINQMIDDFVSENKHNTKSFTSMGQVHYLSALKHVDAVVGNSSSGIIEAPSLGTPTVNIGDRQKGRVKADSIIDCKPTTTHIHKAMKKALSQAFKINCQHIQNPYEKTGTANNILQVITNTDLSGILKKSFYNLPVSDSKFRNEN